LPHARALSPREAEQIREFVRAGGLVVADLVPGILDHHGKRLGQSLLANLFPSEEPGTVTAVGEGHAVLVGDRWVPDEEVKNLRVSWRDHIRPVRDLGALLVRGAGLRPAVRVVPPEETPIIPPEEIVRFTDGAMLYVGAQRNYFFEDFDEYPVTIEFPQKGHLYDVRADTYLGYTDRLSLALSWRPYLWAIAPYRVQGVRIETPSEVRAGQKMLVRVRVLADSEGLERHVLRVEWSDPAGESLAYYSRDVVAPAGQAEFTMRWALNETPGLYRLVVRDVMSGERGEVTVAVTETEGAP